MSSELDKILEAFQDDDFPDTYLSKIDSNVLLDILKLSVHKNYSKGDIIVSIDDECVNLGFLLKGAIRSYYIDPNGNDLTKHLYVENSFFLDEVLFDYEKSICFYEALEDCEMLYINVKLLKNIIYGNEILTKFYIQCLESGLRYKVGRENSFLVKSATERYLDLKKDYPSLEGRIRQSYIATYLGVKAESLSRIRKGVRE